MLKPLALAVFLAYALPGLGQDDNEINTLIDQWHRAAAEANAQEFFGFIDEDGIYIGTDAHERWTKNEFVSFAKPYFDRGNAWDFKPHHRDVHFGTEGKYVWFSELLSTWMGECRGSGVLVSTPEGWRLKQYHLSVTVPNEIIKSFIKLVEDYHTTEKK